ncbi:ankyrin repeat domain-containing protein SOWAHC [Bufo bufo]|uniref:ankyrin repeat domain-containing protein SOWAHC n=1 Tax=Bufo bufo TaxID=8384 RepID=UPI001ABDBA68|nr:ankyrin repeat domain-containing protein SOWAHC [Bufo bufo]
MSDISRDSVIFFLRERGGRVPNQQLVEHFRPLLTAAPPGEARAANRQLFKDIVNEVASVRAEDEVKYVCLRKKYRKAAESGEEPAAGARQPEPGGSPISAHSPDSSSGEDASSTPEPSEEPPEEHPPDSGEETGDGSPGYDAPPIISVTEEPEDESQAAKRPPELPDVSLLSGRTPRNSRRGVRDPVSPQLRRGGLLLRAGLRDSDSSSLHSSSSVSGNEEDEAGSVALEPLEHAWMLSSCRARWDSLQELLLAEPGLVTRRDFITGFSCLHWAAKHGQHELLAALLTHARQHRVPVNINARASGGYTALHLAAMHGHLDVIKLLVGAYDAELDIRDYSGRKAWQYLSPDTARDVQALVGAVPAAAEEDEGSSGAGRWRLSRVLPSQLIVHRLSQLPEDELDGGGRPRGDISRKGSGRPRLNKIRFRTQIIHSNLSARDPEDEMFKSPMRHRPKSNVFG